MIDWYKPISDEYIRIGCSFPEHISSFTHHNPQMGIETLAAMELVTFINDGLGRYWLEQPIAVSTVIVSLISMRNKNRI